MKNVAAYLKTNRKMIVLMALWTGIFLAIFFLSRLPLEAVGYGMLLFTVLGGICMVIDFRKFVQRLEELEQAKKHIAVSGDRIPLAENPLEERYQELLGEVFRCKCRLESEYDNRCSEMMDYYTMWVHQIKTPIAAMHLLLQSEEVPDKGELEEQLFKTEEYVGMVLQYLRVGDMAGDLKFRQYSLDGVVRQAVRKYSKSFIRKHLRLDYQDLDCTVVTDEKWLLFVIEQILSNAVKYTASRGGVSVYMDRSRPKTLVIEDTGIGISLEDLPRIFEKGFTGYNGRRDKKSTGLGLYLCKTIMDKLNHEITITSVEGEGTRVALGLETAKLEVD
ncbi:sensor histidine kinase [Lachnospiraceae bacterium 46-15]